MTTTTKTPAAPALDSDYDGLYEAAYRLARQALTASADADAIEDRLAALVHAAVGDALRAAQARGEIR